MRPPLLLSRTPEAEYRAVIRLDPNEPRANWGLSEVLEKRGDMDGANHETREYIRKGDPDNDGEARVAVLCSRGGRDVYGGALHGMAFLCESEPM